MSVQQQPRGASPNSFSWRKAHIPLESYCVLCRVTLDIHSGRHTTAKPPEATALDCKSQVMCFFETTTSNRNHHVHIFRTDLRYANWKNADPATESLLRQERLVLCGDYPNCNGCLTDSSRTANFVHVACLKIAHESFGLFSARALYQIARLLRPAIPWPQISLNLGEDDLPLSLPTIPVSEETNLGQLILTVRRELPAEIQLMICSYLTRNHFLSVSRTSDTLNFIRRHAIQQKGETVTVVPGLLPLGSPSPLTAIYATPVEIMGETCFKGIEGHRNTASDLSIPVTDSNVQAIRVGLGTYGVVGLKILYRDGSSSPWLGRSPQKWVQTIHGSDLSMVRAWMDEFRLNYIDFAQDSFDAVKSPFWRQGRMPPEDTKCVIVDGPDARARIRNTFNSRAVEYLPLLQNDGKKIRSLTVFLQSNRIRCIQAGDNPAQRLGNPCPMQTDWPVTYYIQPEETFTSVHLLSGLMGGPFLLMTTSKGRTLYWGPHALPFNPYTRITTLKHESMDALVDGLLADPMAVTNEGQRSLGVVLKPEGQSDESMFSYQNRLPPDPLRFYLPKGNKYHVGLSDPDKTRYITQTNLANVHVLKVQQGPDAYLGLWILRHDGTIDTLGRWDPSAQETISQLYNSESDGPLQALTFLLSRNKEKVTGILLGESSETESKFVWDRPDEDVVWWLGKNFNHVEYWEGMTDMTVLQPGNMQPQLVQ